VVNSGTTSGAGTEEDPFLERKSRKVFSVLNGGMEEVSDLKHLHHEVQDPARDMHIVPGLATASLVSTGKFADADYTIVFGKKEVRIYDATNTETTITRGAILKGWKCRDGLYRIPLVSNVKNLNTDTSISNKPTTELLSHRLPPTQAIHNVYELRAQQEVIRYNHAAAGFPTKATWIAAIKNK
jgi:hypothetical protein